MYRNIYGHIRTSWDLIQTDKPDIVLVNKQHKHSCSGPQTKQHQRKKKTHTKKKKKKSTKNIKGCERIWRKMQAVKETVGPVVIGSLRAVKQKFGEWLQQILSNF